MSSKRLNVGFIGLSTTGWAAKSNAPALLQSSLQEKFKLTAISTSSSESATVSAKTYSEQAGGEVKPYHGSSKNIASDPDVDLVVVSVKAPLHKEVALPAIETGKQVFIEWPVGTSMQDTLDIAAAAKEKGVTPFVGLQARTSNVVKKVKELVDGGKIGKIRSSTFISLVPRELLMWTPFPDPNHGRYALEKKHGATPLIVVGGHNLDAFTHTLGHFTSITASASQAYPTLTFTNSDGKATGETMHSEFNDHYTFSGPLTSGAHATFILQVGVKFVPGRKTLQWTIEGDEGVIRVESEFIMGGCVNISSPLVYLNGEKVEVEGVQTGGFDAVGILVNQWEEIFKGDEGLCATIEDAIKNRVVLDAVEKSAAQGTTISLDF